MLDNPFDIAHKTAMPLIKIEEDCHFLTAHRKERLGKMGPIEQQLQLVLQGKRKPNYPLNQTYTSKVRKETRVRYCNL